MCEVFDSKGSRHDDEFEGVALCLPLGDDPGEESDEDVGEDGPLVSLVDDDGRVLGQQEVSLDLPQQHAVSHELDTSLVSHRAFKPDLNNKGKKRTHKL